jgi:hypothetical protein
MGYWEKGTYHRAHLLRLTSQASAWIVNRIDHWSETAGMFDGYFCADRGFTLQFGVTVGPVQRVISHNRKPSEKNIPDTRAHKPHMCEK